MKYKNQRYGNPQEMEFYALGVPIGDTARRLRRHERTVRDWLSGKQRVPWWVPEVLRLWNMEHQLRLQQMGIHHARARLGPVDVNLLDLTGARSEDPAPERQPQQLELLPLQKVA
ncbi:MULTISPECIES: hypothetical protein [unclassified Caballeronia]|uniref:hypothetical protein n=1 Tax=unclassified Caballeronia TaxID=2646786 RepID=UPI00202895B7|nr:MULTISPECIES: hypothetical protein [unclassified Caballeronia]